MIERAKAFLREEPYAKPIKPAVTGELASSIPAQARLDAQVRLEQQAYTGTNGDNRRYHERFKLSIPTRVIGHDLQSGKWDETTQTLDVSRAGITIRLHRRVRHGMVVQLMLPLPVKLRSYGYYDSNYKVYAIARRVDPVKGGQSVVAFEFIGENPPKGYQEKPWTVFQHRKWAGSERRREPRSEKPEVVAIEYLNEEMQTIGRDVVLSENHSRGGLRVRLQEAPPEFYMVKVIGPATQGEKTTIVSNRYLGSDGCERLCLRYVDETDLISP